MEEELRILLLDDNPDGQALVLKALEAEKLDCSPRCVSSTQAFMQELESYKKFPPLQAPATYNLEQVQEQLRSTGTAAPGGGHPSD